MTASASFDFASWRADPSMVPVAEALDAALKARAPGVQAATSLVVQVAGRLGREMGLADDAQALLEVAARVRDIGLLGLPDSVVLATRPLSPDEWALIILHPERGAELLEQLAVLAPAAGVVRSHHERWDGRGYPDGLSGSAIPLLSRIIATCDAFVGIASDRPHRRGLGAAAAIEVVRQERGTQFDPETADALVSCLAAKAARHGTSANGAGVAKSDAQVDQKPLGPEGFKRAVLAFDVVSVLSPAWERLHAATESRVSTGAELVMAVESDTGLTVAVLRVAQGVAGRRPVVNVPDAVAALGRGGIAEAVGSLPRVGFPWRTSRLEVLMHGCLVHSQAVARAADHLSRELELPFRDELLVAALLHDVGKLALGRVAVGHSSAAEVTATPEARIREERRAWGLDHASLGGLLLGRWGLAPTIVGTVARHHSAEDEDDIATYVRLADLLAHHAQGHAVDREQLLRLAQLCRLPNSGLRGILFDLPHAGASTRRRAEKSPLSIKQTAILSLLAKGRRYKEIAAELGVATSTIRTHLHRTYETLGVDDRAQAVLRATEMGWI